ncbi:MAG: SDR family oxidoreductase [Candidatus Brocadiia bacterium]
MAVYVVTGGAGFIGSNIVERLVGDGHEVRVVDDLSTGRRENLDGLLDRIAFHEQDICDADALLAVCRGADYVLHQAALASVQRSVEQPIATNRVNVQGTLTVLAAARDGGVRRVVYASSSSVYGDAPTLPKHEDMTPAPLSPYAVSKLAGEHYCAAFANVYGISTVSLRYFNVFGPRQDPNSQYAAVVPIFMQCLLSGKAPQVFGDGEQSRDFTHVDNVVQANLLAAEAQLPAGQNSAVCNVGCAERHTLNELLEILGEMVGAAPEARYGPERPGDVRHSLADIGRARELLGYQPAVGFREGLRRTLEWHRKRT